MASATPAAPVTLKVRRVRLSRQYEGQELVYRRSALVYEPDYYNLFFVPPGSMFTDAARRWLARAGIFDQVVDSASALDATYVLEGVVNALYGDFPEGAAEVAAAADPARAAGGDSAVAVLEVQFFLLRPGVENSDVVYQRTFVKSAPLAGRTPEDLVHGWNVACAETLGELEADLARLPLR